MINHPHGYCLIGPVLKTDRDLDATARIALIEWLEAHGIDHTCVPLRSTVLVDAEAYTITYTKMVLDADGKPVPRYSPGGAHNGVKTETVVHQGEAPPLPWPSALQTCPLLGSTAVTEKPRDTVKNP